MEQHPVPQDITGFKFKLVGDMTLTQFGYLASGSVLAYLSFVSKFPFLVKWPLVILFGFTGVALAFFPVEERPLDRWIVAFIKAIYSPTQYLWQKKGILPDFFKINYLSTQSTAQTLISTYNGDRQRLEDYLKILPRASNSVLDAAEQAFFQKLNTMAAGNKPLFTPRVPLTGQPIKPPSLPPSQPPAPPTGFAIVNGKIVRQTPVFAMPPPVPRPPQPNKEEIKVNHLSKLQYQNDALERQATNLKEEINELKKAPAFTIEDLNKLKALAQKAAGLENQKSKAQEEITRLKQLLGWQKTQGVKPVMEQTSLPQTPRVKFVPRNQARQVGLPNPPQTPNIVSGLVVDQKGEILPGVIVVIKDIYDNPVRAIKTNKLGQFSISTPLPNAIYNLELEKEGYNFDIIEVEVKGEIIPPMEIKAKQE